MEQSVRDAEHAALLQRYRDAHSAWDENERRAAEKRAAEDAERTARHIAEQQRRQEQLTAQQRVWGDRLHVLQGQLAALNSGISTASAHVLNALADGDIDAAGDAQARALGLVALRDRAELDLAGHKRFG
jgi:hypothetical protein